jgi:hypothetical protein
MACFEEAAKIELKLGHAWRLEQEGKGRGGHA